MIKKIFKNQKGFSLVEILIASAILLIFVGAISIVFVNINKQLQSSARKDKAILLAEELLEKARNERNADFNTLANYNDTVDSIYTRTLTIVTPNSSFPEQKRADVVVTWADPLSSNNSVNVSSYFTNWKTVLPSVGLTVNKVVINHGGTKTATDFEPYETTGYTLDYSTDPPSQIQNTITFTLGQPTSVLPGTYTIRETTDTNYITTFSGDCNSSGQVSISSGQSKTCTITNEQKYATLTLNKIVINHGLTKVASDFAPFTLDSSPSTVLTLGTPTNVSAGTFNISENNDANYNTTFSGDCNSSGGVTLSLGDSKTCTITNEEKLSYITVVKNVINHGLAKVASDFAPFKVGSTTVSLNTQTTINSGTYTVSETPSSNYTASFSGDCNSSGSVSITSGTSKTCTITNEENPLGIIVYGDGTTIPKYRNYYNDNSFSPENSSISGGNSRSFEIKTSPAKREVVSGYVDSSGVLHTMCYNGISWAEDWSVAVGGTGNTRRFDIEYETNSGDVLVVYSTNTGGNNELAYRTKLGTSSCGGANWSSAISFDPVRTTGIVHWVKMARDRRSSSNIIGLIWADANSDLSGAIWNGNSFVNEPTTAMETSLEFLTTSQDVEDFDVDYESTSGDLMVVWANSVGKDGTNGVRYRVCTGGISTCTWGSVTTPPTFSDDATNLDLSANPNSNEMVFASIGNAASDMQIGYWSGSAWTNKANVDTSCGTPFAGSKKVATGWLISGVTSRSIIVYEDQNATNIGWYIGSGGTFTVQADFTPTPILATNQGWYDVETDPINKDRLIFSVVDGANDLSSKRLIMTSTPTFTLTNIGTTALSTILPQKISSPFAFKYWNN